MIVSLAFTLLVMMAAGVWLGRRLVAAARRRALVQGPGASPDHAITIRRFDDMDTHLRPRPCPCGGRLEHVGEGTRRHEGRMLRVARLECARCETVGLVYFDTSDLVH